MPRGYFFLWPRARKNLWFGKLGLKHFSLSLRHLRYAAVGSIIVKNALPLPLAPLGSIEQKRLNTSAKSFKCTKTQSTLVIQPLEGFSNPFQVTLHSRITVTKQTLEPSFLPLEG